MAKNASVNILIVKNHAPICSHWRLAEKRILKIIKRSQFISPICQAASTDTFLNKFGTSNVLYEISLAKFRAGRGRYVGSELGKMSHNCRKHAILTTVLTVALPCSN